MAPFDLTPWVAYEILNEFDTVRVPHTRLYVLFQQTMKHDRKQRPRLHRCSQGQGGYITADVVVSKGVEFSAHVMLNDVRRYCSVPW
jgi:hypothetical protein